MVETEDRSWESGGERFGFVGVGQTVARTCCLMTSVTLYKVCGVRLVSVITFDQSNL